VLIILVLLPLNCGSSRSVYFKHQNSGGSLLISIPFSTTSLNLNFICLLRTMPCDSLNYSCSEIPASIAMSFLCPLCIERFSSTFFFILATNCLRLCVSYYYIGFVFCCYDGSDDYVVLGSIVIDIP
jgi:hypothetical protein